MIGIVTSSSLIILSISFWTLWCSPFYGMNGIGLFLKSSSHFIIISFSDNPLISTSPSAKCSNFKFYSSHNFKSLNLSASSSSSVLRRPNSLFSSSSWCFVILFFSFSSASSLNFLYLSASYLFLSASSSAILNNLNHSSSLSLNILFWICLFSLIVLNAAVIFGKLNLWYYLIKSATFWGYDQSSDMQ